MADIPTTSTTLLRDLANDSQHVRWDEFVACYRPMMEAFMRERFPSLDADDVIQETLIAVCTALPSYRYVPEEKGYFHNYLTGILRNKALRQLHKDQRQAEIAEMLGSRRSRWSAEKHPSLPTSMLSAYWQIAASTGARREHGGASSNVLHHPYQSGAIRQLLPLFARFVVGTFCRSLVSALPPRCFSRQSPLV